MWLVAITGCPQVGLLPSLLLSVASGQNWAKVKMEIKGQSCAGGIFVVVCFVTHSRSPNKPERNQFITLGLGSPSLDCVFPNKSRVTSVLALSQAPGPALVPFPFLPILSPDDFLHIARCPWLCPIYTQPISSRNHSSLRVPSGLQVDWLHQHLMSLFLQGLHIKTTAGHDTFPGPHLPDPALPVSSGWAPRSHRSYTSFLRLAACCPGHSRYL